MLLMLIGVKQSAEKSKCHSEEQFLRRGNPEVIDAGNRNSFARKDG
jgi:hypothetical protein